MTQLECHSHGDRRFSAFYARLADGRYIEAIYQQAKRDAHGQPFSRGKGQAPSYLFLNGKLVSCTNFLRQEFYLMLWYIYLKENPDLLTYARTHDTFRDQFAWKGGSIPKGADYYYLDGRGCNQAAAIAYLCTQMDIPLIMLFSGEVLTALEKYMALAAERTTRTW